MSNKMECPVCKSYSSTIYQAVVIDGGDCPVCGAPGEVIDRIDRLQQKRADDGLKVELTQALTDLAKVTAERDRLARVVEAVREAMQNNEP